mmetsp:Transcript_66658/g.105443  ORF Transcript_66658/g.105443 Transcript_66658/m.105443 type:complete len:193 (+) Transcript_66658:32-610(+)
MKSMSRVWSETSGNASDKRERTISRGSNESACGFAGHSPEHRHGSPDSGEHPLVSKASLAAATHLNKAADSRTHLADRERSPLQNMGTHLTESSQGPLPTTIQGELSISNCTESKDDANRSIGASEETSTLRARTGDGISMDEYDKRSDVQGRDVSIKLFVDAESATQSTRDDSWRKADLQQNPLLPCYVND